MTLQTLANLGIAALSTCGLFTLTACVFYALLRMCRRLLTNMMRRLRGEPVLVIPGQALVNSIRPIRYEASESSQHSDDPTCSICLSDMEPGQQAKVCCR